jgi:hypothetical protein
MRNLTVHLLMLTLLVVVGCVAADAEGRVLSISSPNDWCGQAVVPQVATCDGNAACADKTRSGDVCDVKAQCGSTSTDGAQCGSPCGAVAQCRSACADAAQCGSPCGAVAQGRSACADVAQCGSPCGAVAQCRSACADAAQCGSPCGAVAQCGKSCNPKCAGNAPCGIARGGGRCGIQARCDSPRYIRVLRVVDCGDSTLVVLDVGGAICVLRPVQSEVLGGYCDANVRSGRRCGDRCDADPDCCSPSCKCAGTTPRDTAPKNVVRRIDQP